MWLASSLATTYRSSLQRCTTLQNHVPNYRTYLRTYAHYHTFVDRFATITNRCIFTHRISCRVLTICRLPEQSPCSSRPVPRCLSLTVNNRCDGVTRTNDALGSNVATCARDKRIHLHEGKNTCWNPATVYGVRRIFRSSHAGLRSIANASFSLRWTEVSANPCASSCRRLSDHGFTRLNVFIAAIKTKEPFPCWMCQ